MGPGDFPKGARPVPDSAVEACYAELVRRLLEYVRHKRSCSFPAATRCDCGLSELVEESLEMVPGKDD
jgi:hypothetical protein